MVWKEVLDTLSSEEGTLSESACAVFAATTGDDLSTTPAELRDHADDGDGLDALEAEAFATLLDHKLVGT